MKITKTKLKKLILKELKDTYSISFGSDFPPIDNTDRGDRGGGKCKSFIEIHKTLMVIGDYLWEWFIETNRTDNPPYEIYHINIKDAINQVGMHFAKELIKLCGPNAWSIKQFMFEPLRVMIDYDDVERGKNSKSDFITYSYWNRDHSLMNTIIQEDVDLRYVISVLHKSLKALGV